MMNKLVLIIIIEVVFIIITLFTMIVREAKRSVAYDQLLHQHGLEKAALTQMLEQQRDNNHEEVKKLKQEKAQLQDRRY